MILIFIFLPTIIFGLIALGCLTSQSYKPTGITSLTCAILSGLWLFSSIQDINEFTGIIVAGALVASFIFGLPIIGIAALINNKLINKRKIPNQKLEPTVKTPVD